MFVYSAIPTGGLREIGRISSRFDEAGYAYWWPSFTRGVFIGDKVYAVTNQGVRVAAVSSSALTVENELFYGVEEPPIVVEPMPLDPTVPIASGDPTSTDGSMAPVMGVGSIDSSTTDPNSVVHSVP